MVISRDIDLTERRDFKPIYKKPRLGAPWVERHKFNYTLNDIVITSTNSTMTTTHTSLNNSILDTNITYTILSTSDVTNTIYTTPNFISNLLPWVDERRYTFNNVKIPWLSGRRLYDRDRIDWKQKINRYRQSKRIAWIR